MDKPTRTINLPAQNRQARMEALINDLPEGNNQEAIQAEKIMPLFPDALQQVGFMPLWEQLATREKEHPIDNIEKALFLSDIKRGLEAREFLYFYQPQWHLKTGKIIALDTSLRWKHPQKGLLGIDYFLSVFEETPLMEQLTLLLFEQILNDRSQLILNGLSPYPTIVKLTPNQLKLPRLADDILDLIQQYNIPVSAIECALSKRRFAQRPKTLQHNLDTFHQAGMALMIDEFGAGFSAYPYLQTFPFGKIKLEKNYAIHLSQNPRGQLIIQSVMHLAHLMNAQIVIDGIDSLPVMRWLTQIGCDLGQGCFLGGAMSLEYLIDFLEDFRKISHNDKTALENFWQTRAKQAHRFSPDCPQK